MNKPPQKLPKFDYPFFERYELKYQAALLN